MKIKDKINKIKENKKGFTLTELIVAFGILAVIALCVSFLMTSGTNLFVRVNKNINLSYRSQIPVNQLNEYFTCCNGIYVSDDSETVILTELNSDDKLELNVFTYNSSSKTISLANYVEPTIPAGGNYTKTGSCAFAKNVKSFKVTYPFNNNYSAVKLELEVEYSDSSYKKEQIIYMRGNPLHEITKENSDQNEGSALYLNVKSDLQSKGVIS